MFGTEMEKEPSVSTNQLNKHNSKLSCADRHTSRVLIEEPCGWWVSRCGTRMATAVRMSIQFQLLKTKNRRKKEAGDCRADEERIL